MMISAQFLKKKKKITLFFCALALWGGFLGGCRKPANKFSVIGMNPLSDLAHIPQDVTAIQTEPMLAPPTLALLRAKARAAYFLPWQESPCDFSFKADVVSHAQKLAHSGFGENLLPHATNWGDDISKNAAYDTFGAVCTPGVITQTTDLRALPTEKPHFDDPATAGSGYPFDNLQESQLFVGTPVRISHFSKDRAWAFVEANDQSYGWVKSLSVGVVSPKDAQTISALPLAVLAYDDQPVYTPEGRFAFYTKLGASLPLVADEKENVVVLVPTLDSLGNASFVKIPFSKQVALPAPLNFSLDHLRTVAQRLLGKPYGWGTYLGNRDCSALMKDFYAMFGIWLPRNSRRQARAFGKSIDLAGKTDAERLQILHTQGIPYQTLVFRPGHIAMYIGKWQQTPVIFHAPWGVPTKDESQTGRNVIGRSVITSLEYGKDVPFFDSQKGSLLQSATQFVVLDLSL